MKLGKLVIPMIALIIVTIFFLGQSGIRFWNFGGELESPSAVEESVPDQDEVRRTADPDSFPAVEDGVSSWKEVLVLIEKDTEFLRFLEEMTGMTIDDVRFMSIKGYDHVIILPKGTDIVNTGRKDGVFFKKEGPLEKDRAALTDPKGKPVILVSCGNPIRVKPQPKPEPKPQPEPVAVKEPFLRTDNVVSVTQTSGRLAGFVDPKGETVVAWFEYGQGDSLDGKTPEFSVKSPGSFIKTVSGLRSDERYSFRISGRNSEGTFHGDTRTFMTDIVVATPVSQPDPEPKQPVTVEEPVLRTDNATGITRNSSYLNGFADPKGESMYLWFEWGSTASLGNETSRVYTESSRSFDRKITGLSEDKTYHYRIVARDKEDKKYYGDIRSFRTDVRVSEPQPDPPITVYEPVLRTDNVPRVTSTSADLVGFIDPKGVSGRYWFEYGEGDSLNKRTSESSLSSQRDIVTNVSGLRSATKYSFRIVVRIDGKIFHGNTRSFMTDL